MRRKAFRLRQSHCTVSEFGCGLDKGLHETSGGTTLVIRNDDGLNDSSPCVFWQARR